MSSTISQTISAAALLFLTWGWPLGARAQEEVEDVAAEQLKSVEDSLAPADPLWVVPSRERAPPLGSVKPHAEDTRLWSSLKKNAQGRLMLQSGGEWRVTTLDAELQEKMTALLTDYQTPYAAVVALEPGTGRVLAMSEHAEAAPGLRGLVTRALFPAASVFKIVTTAALLNSGVSPDDEACFHGGKHLVSEKMLEDSPRDRQCASLAQALGRSTNGVFVKLVHHHLSADVLRNWAKSFHFNQAIDFSIPVEPSLAAVPEDPLGLAQTGAGFGDVFLSPLHGALLAAVAANHGEWQEPVLWDDALGQPKAPGVVLAPEIAEQLTDMMERTVTEGTARRVFRQRGFRVKGAVGKTGSLADRAPYRDYSWFVGFAPKDAPRVAVAAVVVNDGRWRIRAPFVAREAMRVYLERETGTIAKR